MSAIDGTPGKGTKLTGSGEVSKKLNSLKNDDGFDDSDLNSDELSDDEDDPNKVHEIINDDDLDPAYDKTLGDDIAYDLPDDEFDDEEFEDERDDF